MMRLHDHDRRPRCRQSEPISPDRLPRQGRRSGRRVALTRRLRAPGVVKNRPGGGACPARGQALVEMALLLPLLLLILAAIIDAGILLATSSRVDASTLQGAHYLAAVGANSNNPDPTILAAVLDGISASGLSPNNVQSVTIYAADSPADAQAGDNPVKHEVYICTAGSCTLSPLAADQTFTSTARLNSEEVGLTVRYRYNGFTPLFNQGFTISSVTRAQIDPVSNNFVLPSPVPQATSVPPPTRTPYPTATPYNTATPYPTGPTSTPQPAADLQLSMTSNIVSGMTVSSPDLITYTIGVTNAGPLTATNVSVSALYPPSNAVTSGPLSYPSTWGCPTLIGNQATCKPTTGQMLVGATAIFSFTVRVSATPSSSLIQETASITNTDPTVVDPNLTNNTATTCIPVGAGSACP